MQFIFLLGVDGLKNKNKNMRNKIMNVYTDYEPWIKEE